MCNKLLTEAARLEPTWSLIKSPRDQRVLNALRLVDRAEFLPWPVRPLAYEDMPLPIGRDATCTMPSLVALMADLLELQDGQNVLEIGTGCGYHAAVTKHLIGSGRLTSVEIVPEMHKMAKTNLQRHFKSPDGIELICGDGSVGCASNGPYQRIYFTAASSPGFNYQILFDQLANMGIIVFPVMPAGDLYVLRKNKAGEIGGGAYQGAVSFVPLQGANK